jgi:hypothetical protein
MRVEHLCPSATSATLPTINSGNDCSSLHPPRQWHPLKQLTALGVSLRNERQRVLRRLFLRSKDLTFVTIYLSLGLLQNNENPDKSGNVQRR